MAQLSTDMIFGILAFVCTNKNSYIISSDRISDELLKKAMEEEALLSNKENKAPTAQSTTSSNTSAMENQLKALSDSLVPTDSARQSASESYPAIEFSFMQNSTETSETIEPPAIQIRNNYRGGQGKRRVSGDLTGDEVVEEEATSKRSRSDPQQQKVRRILQPRKDFKL